LVVTVSHATDLPAAREMIERTGTEAHVDVGARQLTSAANGIADLTRVAGWLQEGAIEVDDIGLSRPSLDDVFLSLTGHRAERDDAEEVGA
jgi:ABC-2 type transport system ATP-binding protein